MTSFYGDALGMQSIDETRTDSWAEFAIGEARLALHAIPGHIADQIEVASPPAAREENPIKLVFEVEDVESERARLTALGVTMIQRPWGACDGLDPEGNVFQLCRLSQRQV